MQTSEWPKGKYSVIYADPPWQYDNVRTGGSLKSGASQKYPTMPLDEIKALKVNEISEPNTVLFLWTTVPFLPDALDVMKEWGFRYKTMITWQKVGNGLGYWFRGQTEHLLFGVKGKVKPFRCQEPNFIRCDKSLRHSEKPQEFRELIERATINLQGKRIELFARRSSPNWGVFGNQIEA
jgi:N6-adenosine-specific RNA methylase IME4